jgi:hypothetical protein
MQHGAQLDEQLAWRRNTTCISYALEVNPDPRLLRALLSCPDKMALPAQQAVQQAIDRQYGQPNGFDGWLAFVDVRGSGALPYMEGFIRGSSRIVWPEVRCCPDTRRPACVVNHCRRCGACLDTLMLPHAPDAWCGTIGAISLCACQHHVWWCEQVRACLIGQQSGPL